MKHTTIMFLLFLAGCFPAPTDTTMPARKGMGHYDHRITPYINEQMGGDGWWRHLGYEDVMERLRNHPPGYRRAFCIYISDADIDNGGFDQYFYNQFGFMTMTAIEGYERLGATHMIEIIKSALYVCRKSHPDLWGRNHFEDLPDGYFEGFVPIADNFDELNSLYYEESNRLPGSEDVDSVMADGPMDYYYENFPEDFRR